MYVSHNEITNVCRKAFQGLKTPYGDAVIISNIIADLELIGLDGIKGFIKALDSLKRDTYQPAKIETYNANISVNLNDDSILCYLPNLLAYSYDVLADYSEVSLNIENCRDRLLACGLLDKLTKKRLSIKAQWLNRSSPKKIVYIMNSKDTTPNIYLSDKPCINNQDLNINISKNQIELPNTNSYDICLDSKTLLKKRNEILEKGIYISEQNWNTVAKAARSILVPNSNQSKLGAGGI
ncbi:hypothetical protein fh0823_25470 [Francisella halioticida]|uniref:DUF3726 domain-containing protein n=1 Tax=Francisella halioticida TaxID=549298 RepID=A0ABM6LXG3_9GAMM|nr:DUF3726 domain-containing protein [Francisella halioticida]ASG67259.1 hypothetical protein CDV26_01625 [Francisella halioticida]BCD92408.1 hypothetical protein fh0823_25470 [Francisella halioticida]